MRAVANDTSHWLHGLGVTAAWTAFWSPTLVDWTERLAFVAASAVVSVTFAFLSKRALDRLFGPKPGG